MKSCSNLTTHLTALFTVLLAFAITNTLDASKKYKSKVTFSKVTQFQAAGDVGGGVLVPGTFFPPEDRGWGRLLRKRDRIETTIVTSGLPEGPYTVWWVAFNNPDGCDGEEGCDPTDLLNPAAEPSVFYATNGMVGEDGRAMFRATYYLGGFRGAPGTQNVIDFGFPIDPKTAEIHNIIKYHGPASDDVETLHFQLTSLLGACEEGANAVDLGDPFGVQCFDPQAVVFPAPKQHRYYKYRHHDDDDD